MGQADEHEAQVLSAVKPATKWTQFWDMHSGGDQKLDWARIYIEAPKEEAIVIFYNLFGRNPKRVTCTCCGEDYAIDESDSLEQASAWHRNCDYAYFDKNGKEVDENVAWKSGKGLLPGFTDGYVERDRRKLRLRGGYVPLSEYVKNPDVRVVYAKDITMDMRIGEVPDEGYTWVGGE